jgi:hypothetical protein
MDHPGSISARSRWTGSTPERTVACLRSRAAVNRRAILVQGGSAPAISCRLALRAADGAVPEGPPMKLLRPSLAFLRRHQLLTFILMGAFFLLSGISSIDLYVVLRANIELFQKYGTAVIDDGALQQLFEILGMLALSVLFFILFIVCERIVVDRLTATLRDVGGESPG